jgi:PAS domain S-box-containing protein
MKPTDINPPEYAATAQQRVEELRKIGHSFSEIAQVRRDGTIIPTELSSRIIDYKGKQAVLSIARDITERKRVQDALHESEERYRDLFENSTDLIQSVNNDGRFEYVNAKWLEALGYTREEIKQLTLMDILRKDQVPHCNELFERVRNGEALDRVETVFVSKDGREILVDGSVNGQFKNGQFVATRAIFRDITERKKIERMKDQFVSMVSHELRTPLTSIRASLGLLASGVIGALPEKGQRMLEIAVTNTDRLVRLINDILDSERLASGKTPMEKKQCSTAQLVKQASDVMKPMAEKAGVSLSVESKDAELWADPDRIVQALTNLISNAIKFSSKGGKICVAAERKENQMLFKVQDEGHGIPPDKLGLLFERFQQLDSSDARERGGSGLGLSISRSIIEQHNGKIWVESTVGKGSTFFFTVPLLLEAQVPLQPEATTGAPSTRKVLIIEDDPDLANILAAMLERHNIQSHIVLTGGKGIALSKQMHPDLIVLDLILPDMDGSIVVEDLRKDNILRSVPLVVYTVRELDEQQRENLRLGETLFFTKSRIPPDQFEEKVIQFMERISKGGGKTDVN